MVSMVNSWSSLAALAFLSMASAKNIPTTSPLIFYHGRWDTLPSSWWPGSGFKLVFTKAPKSLSINVGATASAPPIPVGLRFGTSGEYTTLNLTAGTNALPLSTLLPAKLVYPLTFDIITLFEGGESRLEFQSLDMDNHAALVPYHPKKIALEFIGDSLTAGYINPRGALDAYAFKVGEAFGAEHNQIAQSGACLVAKNCWGNPLGQVDLYFKTQNSAFQWINGNTTTDWDFSKYGRAMPTHVIIALGTNDQTNNVTGTDFQATYVTFLHKLRAVYPTQHIFAMSPWGWPYDGGVVPYLEAETAAAVSTVADPKIHFMKGLGWLPYGPGVNYYDDGHPTPTGHSIIAKTMVDWLRNWGLGKHH